MKNATGLTARPTTYKGVAMRSRLEARYAAWLDRQGFDWKYEPKAFASEEGQYLPDFQTTVRFLGRERTAYIETKPIWAHAPERYVKRITSIIQSSEPEALVIIEIDDWDRPLVCLPASFNLTGSVDCHWLARDGETPELGFLAEQEWREQYG